MKKLLGAVVLAVAAPAFADTITLRNGRKIEGHLVYQSATAVTIQVPGGQMDLPRSQIAEIEKKLSIEDEYALRYQRIDLRDPTALDALAGWARAHDLDAKARSLEEHARGVRLELRFEHARTALEWVEVAAWAKAEAFGVDVRRLALARALEADPKSAAARRELASLDREELEAEKIAQRDAQRALEDRERTLLGRERAVAARERALRDTTPRRGTEEPPRDELPPEAPPEAPLDAPPGAEPPPPLPPVFIFRRRGHRGPGDDDETPPPISGKKKDAPPPPPPPRAPHVNPLPPAPQLPPTPFEKR